jgi:ubiquinone biosynthesis protein UbiJ
MPPTKIGEDSQFTIPLRSLIALVAGTAIAVSAYVNITQQLTENSHSIDMIGQRVKDIEAVAKGWSPPPYVLRAVEDVSDIRLQIENLKTRLKFLEGKSNE